MLSLVSARTDQQYESLLNLIYNQKSPTLTPHLDLVSLTWEQFGCYFRRTGTAYQVFSDNRLVGLCWVDEQADRIFLLGLIIQPECQGQGIGTQVLTWLEQNHPPSAKAIELQVHCSNRRAKALYEHIGYNFLRYEPASGFYTLCKPLVEAQPEM